MLIQVAIGIALITALALVGFWRRSALEEGLRRPVRLDSFSRDRGSIYRRLRSRGEQHGDAPGVPSERRVFPPLRLR